MTKSIKVKYTGLFGHIVIRHFNDLAQAEAWARQYGIFSQCSFEEI